MRMFTHTSEGWHPFLIFFLQESLNWQLPRFVLFLEVAELVFRQSGIEKNPFSLLHKSAWRCFSLRKDRKGPNESTWSKWILMPADFGQHVTSFVIL